MQGDYNTKPLIIFIFKMAAAHFFNVCEEETNKMAEKEVAWIIV